MSGLTTYDAVIDYAIREEEKAHALYTELAGRIDRDHLKRAFLELAAEEQKHKEKDSPSGTSRTAPSPPASTSAASPHPTARDAPSGSRFCTRRTAGYRGRVDLGVDKDP